jgi:subtilisin-like proprotein convertase family protein
MIRRFATAGSVLALVLAWASLASTQSAPPERIAFQGRLTGADGNPVTNGGLSMTFSIYASATAPYGSYLWRETQTVAVSGGLYSVQLGGIAALPASLFPDHATERWLGVKVGGDDEMTPRYALTGSPYARRAQTAGTADTALTANTANSATTAANATNALQLGGQLPATYLDLSLHTGNLSAAQLPAGGTWSLSSPLNLIGAAQISGGLTVDTLRNYAGNAQLNLTDEASFTETQHENIAILDGVLAGVSDDLVLTDMGIASKILVSVHITNPDVSTIRIELTAPDSKFYVLKDYGSGSGTDYANSWPVPTLPVSGDLSYWSGRNPQGMWRLHVIDNVYSGGSDGNVVAWSIKHFRSGMTVAGQGSFTAGSGIPPLQVSTAYAPGANVTNLSADLLDGKHFTDFIQNQTDLVQTGRFNISGNALIGGNVGIGTTAPACSLDVSGLIRAGSQMMTGVHPYFGCPGWWKEGAEYTLLTEGTNTWINSPGEGGTIFFRRQTGLNVVELLTLLPNGNVGIGTTTPTRKLEVRGDGDTSIRINSGNTSANSAALEFSNGADAKSYIYYGGTGAPFYRGNWLHLEVPSGAGGISFDTFGYNPRMVVMQDGNVNIGTPMPDGYPAMFHVSDNRPTNGWGFNVGIHSETNNPGTGGTLDQYAVFGSAGTAGTGNQYGVYGTASGGGQNVGIFGSAAGGGTNWAGYFDAGNVYISGRLGVGTTTPAYKLNVAGVIGAGDADFTCAMIGNPTAFGYSNQYAGFWKAGATDYSFLTDGNNTYVNSPGVGGHIYFNNRNADRMTICADGSVGIGTSTPAAGVKLDVQGGLYVDNGNVGFGCQPSPDYRFVAVGNSCVDGRVCIGRVYTPVNNHLVVSGNAAVDGNLYVDKDLNVHGAKLFKIDHPLDPANKYLNHSCVESNDVMNLYNGIVMLDEKGDAVVAMPDWFEALNRDFRYQLTCVGGFSPVYVAEKISGNRFKIAGGKPGLEVSWQVTGVRHDPYVEKNRILVEEPKPEAERGKYLYPEGYGKPVEARIGYAPEAAKAGK